MSIPGVEAALHGEGALEWSVEKTGSAAPETILTYHFESPVAEVQSKYVGRVKLSFINGSLLLTNAKIQDSGKYTLKLLSKGKMYFHVRKVVEPISKIEVVASCSLCECNVTCKVSGDVWNMTWWTNSSELIQNFTRVGNISVLTAAVDSHNTYNCVAWNPVSKLHKTFLPAPGDYGGLPFFGLLIAALIFSIPTVMCWTVVLLNKLKMWCNPKFENVCLKCPVYASSRFRRTQQSLPKGQVQSKGVAVERSALVSWLLFLLCSLVLASILYSSTVPYGFPGFLAVYMMVLSICLALDILLLLMDRLKSSFKRCSMFEGKLQVGDTVCRLCALGCSFATLILYVKTDFTACRQLRDFGWTISISVVVPVGIIVLVYLICRYSCRLHDGANTCSQDENRPSENIEIQNSVNTSLERSNYLKVPNGEEFGAP